METNKHVKINYGPQIVIFVYPVVAVVGCSNASMLHCKRCSQNRGYIMMNTFQGKENHWSLENMESSRNIKVEAVVLVLPEINNKFHLKFEKKK